jgi:hypothetical protein
MLKSDILLLKSKTARVGSRLACLFVAFLSAMPSAAGQQLVMSPFPTPDAIAANDTTTTNLEVSGFNGTVSLSCQVTPAANPQPTCTPSPASHESPFGANINVNGNLAAPGLYTFTVTATAAGTAPVMAQQNLSILAVAPSFNIQVTTPVSPGSVHAGNGGQGTITVTPVNGYSSPGGNAGVALSCSTITPLVTTTSNALPPVCSFTYAPNTQGVVVNGSANTATITITTFGPITTGAVAQKKSTFYALWLPLPMLALIGLGAAAGRKRARKAWGLLALFVVGGSFILVPACGTNSGTNTTTPNGTTPNNSYTFTVMGVDANGTTSSNTAGPGGKTAGAPTVTLTVN